MKYIFSLIFLSFVIIYFLTKCASITPPGGGPRDTIPPVLIRSIPEHKSLNFSGNSITLVYDEYLKIDNLNKQLIITPIIQDDYEQKIRRNSIELIFPEPFKDSTTYTLNFQDAIQDITEGNVTEDNVLAFSTGNYIDSLYINGKVMELLTNKPVDDFTVCLYLFDDTLDIFNSPPIYLTKTNKDGIYLIENIKNGTYRLYVYDDANSNLTCDMPREMFGFSSDTISLYSNIDSAFLKVQNLDMRNIEIQRANTSGRYFEIKTNKPIVDYSVLPMDTTHTIYHNFVQDKKTIRFYNNLDDNDSIQFIFTAIDSLDNTFIDTLYLKFIETKRDFDEFTFSVEPKNNSRISDDFIGKITFNKPITHINFDSLYFEYDSVTFQYLSDTVTYSLEKRKDVFNYEMDLFFTEYLKSLIRADTLPEGISETRPTGVRSEGSSNSNKKLIFHIRKGAFISADGDSCKSQKFEYQLLKTDNFGIIKGNVISQHNSFNIQLLKGNNEVVSEVQNEKQYVFNQVNAGEYSIRVFIDNNNNGKWDPGNIFKNEEPEDIFFYPERITIRANWELTDINLEF
jgi:uncharacterized protein (DUF2141 family)